MNSDDFFDLFLRKTSHDLSQIQHASVNVHIPDPGRDGEGEQSVN